MYILGKKFHIETDHSLPPQILRFRLRLARFDYRISHVPGKLLYTADTLSRAPCTSKENYAELQQDTESFIEITILNLTLTESRLQLYYSEQDEDELCHPIKTYSKKGWPEKKDLDTRLISYWKARGNLSLDSEGLLLYGSRIVVPHSLRQETLERIHNGHQGVKRYRLRAKISVWCPGISKK